MKRLLALLLVGACGDDDAPVDLFDAAPPVDVEPRPDAGYAWDLPPGFPEPLVPPDNPMSAVKVELGRHLFYDVRLSGNQTMSCATCHRQELAFTDGRATALGSTEEAHPRGSMSLTNVAYLGRLTWGNPLLADLEPQTLAPLLGDRPVELGMKNREAELLERLAAEPRYAPMFAAAFPGGTISVQNVVRAISAFERTLLSGHSAYDQWLAGDEAAMSESARRGYALFNSEKLECFHCHQGFNFQDTVKYVGKPLVEARFHNTALYDIDGLGGYPAPNTGIHELTGDPADMGRFRAPTLRNIAVTAPYMHDGSVATLSEVLDHYAAGGRTDNPLKSGFLVGFDLTAEERADVLAFLASLTDEEFLHDPRFADPWPAR